KKTPAGMMGRSTSVDIRPGETAEVEIDLRGIITLTGRIYLGESPVPRGRVGFSLDSKKTRSSSWEWCPTDDEGDYAVKLPRPGRYRVSLFTEQSLHGGGTSAEYDRLLEVADVDERRQDLHFSTARIRGRVVEAKGKPISNAWFELYRALQAGESSEGGEGGFLLLRTDEAGQDGTFESEFLRAGEYRLEIGARGFARKTIGPVTLGHDQSLVLTDIVLEPELSVRVVLLDPHGQPLSGSHVNAYADAAHFKDEWGTSETSGDDGTVTLRGLSPGSYTLVGRSLGLPPAFLENVKVPPEEPASSLVIQFAQGGSLEVQVLNKSGAPVPDLTPILIDRQGRDVTEIYRNLADMTEPFFTDSEGRAWLASVLPGEYEVKAARGESSDSRQVTRSPGRIDSPCRGAAPEHSSSLLLFIAGPGKAFTWAGKEAHTALLRIRLRDGEPPTDVRKRNGSASSCTGDSQVPDLVRQDSLDAGRSSLDLEKELLWPAMDEQPDTSRGRSLERLGGGSQQAN
ncbi:MAG: hypothetical protein DMH00_13365, partial [Acidobacteria bacterium]